MKRIICFLLGVLIWSTSCSRHPDPSTIQQWENEVEQTELAFSAMAQKEGIKDAFLHFAARDAVLMRNNKVYEGYDRIKDYLEEAEDTSWTQQLIWAPDFIKVSDSGDLAYTYGKYEYMRTKAGQDTTFASGIFHTVWERQEDGNWKFVWD